MSDAAKGRQAAAAALSKTVLRPDVGRVLETYRRLDSDEAKARYADHFLHRTAGVMEEIWPTFYELLKRVEDSELYRQEGYVADGQVFGTFKDYFEARVGRPYDTWFDLEATYRYATKFKPELLKKAFSLARSAAEKAGALVKALDAGARINDPRPGPIPKANMDIIHISGNLGGGTSADYLTRRIARERPDILRRMAAGEYRSVRAAALDAQLAPKTQSIRMDDPESAARALRKHMEPDVLARLIQLLQEG